MILFKKQTKQQQQKPKQTNKKPQKWKHSEKPAHSGFVHLTVEISIAHYVEVNLSKKKWPSKILFLLEWKVHIISVSDYEVILWLTERN